MAPAPTATIGIGGGAICIGMPMPMPPIGPQALPFPLPDGALRGEFGAQRRRASGRTRMGGAMSTWHIGSKIK